MPAIPSFIAKPVRWIWTGNGSGPVRPLENIGHELMGQPLARAGRYIELAC
jgi:hypothetical protein